MKITSVTVYKEDKREDSKMRGKAHVVLDDCFAVNNIRILEDEDGLFIAMPNRRVAPGKYKDWCNPINKETRKMFEDAIFEEYNKTE